MKHTMIPFEEILQEENKDEKYIYFHCIEEGYIGCIIWSILFLCACSSGKHRDEHRGIEDFWNKYDFTDTLSDAKRSATGQILMDYLTLLPQVSNEQACNNLKQLVAKSVVNKELNSWLLQQMELLLFEPNSPLRNDEYYMAVLEEALASETIKGMMRVRPMYQLKMLRKNLPGEKAADFEFTLADGRTMKLWDVPAKYTLLMFYDPTCEHCQNEIGELSASPLINRLLSAGEQNIPSLLLVAICMEGDMDTWKRGCAALPAAWVHGYDSKNVLIEKELYSLRSLPSLYLLGEDKMVLLKDAPIGKVLDYLN